MSEFFWNRLRMVLLASFLRGIDDVVRFSKGICSVGSDVMTYELLSDCFRTVAGAD